MAADLTDQKRCNGDDMGFFWWSSKKIKVGRWSDKVKCLLSSQIRCQARNILWRSWLLGGIQVAL